MIEGFEKETSPLNDEEKKLIPILIKGLANKDSKDKAMIGKEICRIITLKYSKLTEPRLRKITNFLRSEKILPVIATSNGYYVSYDKKEIKKQINSLEQRIEAMQTAVNGLKKWL